MKTKALCQAKLLKCMGERDKKTQTRKKAKSVGKEIEDINFTLKTGRSIVENGRY